MTDAERIAEIVMQTPSTERGDLLILVARLLFRADLLYTSSAFESAGRYLNDR